MNGYYGVYGKNGAGIFTNWKRVLYVKNMVIGFKNKKFDNEIEALDYVIAGLTETYAVIDKSNLNSDKLLDNIGRFMNLRALMIDTTKRVTPLKNYWGVPM